VSNPIKHHSVAQHVLRRFCDSDGVLWTYDKEKNQIYPGTPVSQARGKHFYSFKDCTGMKNTKIEKFLSQVDYAGSIAIESLLRKERLTTDRALDFMQFAAAQMLRVETYFQRLEACLSPLLQESAKRMSKYDPEFKSRVTERLKEIGASETDIKGLFASLARGEFKVTANRDYLKATFLQTLGTIVELFRRMRWCFVRIEGTTERFVTSDNPLVLEDIGTDRPQPLGVANPNIEVTMPLSPTVTPVGRWDGQTDYYVISAQSIKVINQRTIDQAHRFVYASHRSDDLLKQVVASQGKQAQTRVVKIKQGEATIMMPIYSH
jgi:hypothetical protein